MPKYIVKHGSVYVGKDAVGPGGEVELTEAQAARVNEGYRADGPKGLAVVPAEGKREGRLQIKDEKLPEKGETKLPEKGAAK